MTWQAVKQQALRNRLFDLQQSAFGLLDLVKAIIFLARSGASKMMIPVLLPEFLGGGIVRVPRQLARTAMKFEAISHSLFKKLRRIRFLKRLRVVRVRRCDGDDPRAPDAGKPSPLMPAPVHHLAAARGIPPSDKTYLFPAD